MITLSDADEWYERRSDAVQGAQDLANDNGTPVCVNFNPVLRMYWLDETPDTFETAVLVVLPTEYAMPEIPE